MSRINPRSVRLPVCSASPKPLIAQPRLTSLDHLASPIQIHYKARDPCRRLPERLRRLGDREGSTGEETGASRDACRAWRGPACLPAEISRRQQSSFRGRIDKP
jgi:hypothetical protein